MGMADEPGMTQEQNGQTTQQGVSSGQDPSTQRLTTGGNGAASRFAASRNQSGTEDESKFVRLHHSDFKSIKTRAREKGRTEALSQLDEQARAAGFESWGAALEELGKLRQRRPPATATASRDDDGDEGGDPVNERRPLPRRERVRDDRNDRVTQQQRAQQEAMKTERDQAVRKWRVEERKRRDLQKQLDAKDAEMQVRESAVAHGVVDVDYAIRLLTRELQGKSEEELKSFDEAAYFGKLRTDKPYLFGERVTPATTGNGHRDAPPVPGSGQVTREAAGEAQFDARNASPADIEKQLQKLGLNTRQA